jgi:hypothetical protein
MLRTWSRFLAPSFAVASPVSWAIEGGRMLIWRTKPVKRRIDVGEVHCPRCGSQHRYQRMSVRIVMYAVLAPLCGLS